MLCLLSNGNSQKWINLLLSPKFGIRHFATESHLKAMSGKIVNVLVKSDKVVIFSKSGCGQCQAAKNLFDDINQKYTSVELDRREDGVFIQNHLGAITGSPLVPRIFIVGKCIGGTYELMELHKNGNLLKLLTQTH